METDNYLQSIKLDSAYQKYYKKSINKTEQQKFLEYLLDNSGDIYNNIKVADIACGGGTLSYHLNLKFKNTSFDLMDLNEEALRIAQEFNTSKNFSFHAGDIYNIPFKDSSFDMVFCWQTLSWLNNPQKALEELIRIVNPGGKVYLSSLFNLQHDVDVYCKARDYTLSEQGIEYQYNTLSLKTIDKWLNKAVSKFRIHEFNPEIDFSYQGRGLGTYTQQLKNKTRIQVSAGILMNWGILEITK